MRIYFFKKLVCQKTDVCFFIKLNSDMTYTKLYLQNRPIYFANTIILSFSQTSKFLCFGFCRRFSRNTFRVLSL